MKEGYDKAKLHEHVWLPVKVIRKNKSNPNKMDEKTFDLLVENIMEKGVTEAIEVRQVGDTYRIISGHHRFDACKKLGWDTVPCVVNNDPDMDDDAELFQLMRMNAIHGQVDPEKFVGMYEQALKKHDAAELQHLFGYADDKEFQKVLKKTEDNLPENMKAGFKQSKKEIKTMDDLAKVLQDLFNKQGDTLPYGYMVFDYEGKHSVWFRMKKGDLKTFNQFAGLCVGKGKAVDDVLRVLFAELADNASMLSYVFKLTPDKDPDAPNHLDIRRPGYEEEP